MHFYHCSLVYTVSLYHIILSLNLFSYEAQHTLEKCEKQEFTIHKTNYRPGQEVKRQ